ncbi:DNA polymerase delta subunit 2 [Enteropsectra breve]|nr:DNA polymerase delta subunit 2 [Enteropsectra breve]
MSTAIRFDIQYNEVYKCRIEEMKKLILESDELIAAGIEVEPLDRIGEKECLVVAALFVVTDLKPVVIDMTALKTELGHTTYMSGAEVFFIEDFSGKLPIEFTSECNRPKALATGTVLGWYGRVNEDKVFKCHRIFYPQSIQPSSQNKCGKIMLINNIAINDGNYEKLRVISDAYNEDISEIIVAENLFTSKPCENSSNEFTEKKAKIDCNAGVLMNKWISDLPKRICLIPGINDPTSKMIPFTPIHKLIFTNTSLFFNGITGEKRIEALTNPVLHSFGNANIIYVASHVVEDMAKYISQGEFKTMQKPYGYQIHLEEEPFKAYKPLKKDSNEDILDMLEQIIQTRHLAPSSPDTVESAPIKDKDIFIIETCDVLVTGGCRSACSRFYNGILLLGLPDFSRTNSAIVLDVGTNEYEIAEIEDIK